MLSSSFFDAIKGRKNIIISHLCASRVVFTFCSPVTRIIYIITKRSVWYFVQITNILLMRVEESEIEIHSANELIRGKRSLSKCKAEA